MEDLLFSIDVIAPLFVMMTFGYCLHWIPFIDEAFLNKMSSYTFRTFLPVLLLSNLYHADLSGFNGWFLVLALAIVLFVALVSMVVFRMLVADRGKQAILVNGTFRSNFAILGAYITGRLYGTYGVAVASLMAAFLVAPVNIMAVLLFTYYGEQGKSVDWRKVAKSIVKNPMILGMLIGMGLNLSGIILPGFVDSAIVDISQCAAPVSLIILGGQFRFSGLSKNLKYITMGTISRLVICPVIAVGSGILLGFRGPELVSLMVLGAAPTSVTGYVMALEANMDGELAGQLVVVTSLFSIFSLFIWIYFLRVSALL